MLLVDEFGTLSVRRRVKMQLRLRNVWLTERQTKWRGAKRKRLPEMLRRKRSTDGMRNLLKWLRTAA